MEKWQGKVAVVTGASSGIGEETCRQLVKNGMVVIGFARRENRLEKLKTELNENFHYVKVDLCVEENIKEAFEWVKSTFNSVDVLVNNAGVIKLGDLLGNTADWKLMFDTNVIGLNICSREAIKIMKENNTKLGHIININSIGGHYRFPFVKDVAPYCSTKRSVTNITENLRELMLIERLPIRITGISPGLVKTEMTAQYNFVDNHENAELLPVDLADAILYALSTPQRVNICDILLRPSNELNIKSKVEDFKKT